MHTVIDPQSLAIEQQELLRSAAANHGRLEIRVSARTHGRAVVAGRASFFDAKDRSIAVRYLEAVKPLVQMLFLRETNLRGQFELTNFGWQVSRKLSH